MPDSVESSRPVNCYSFVSHSFSSLNKSVPNPIHLAKWPDHRKPKENIDHVVSELLRVGVFSQKAFLWFRLTDIAARQRHSSARIQIVKFYYYHHQTFYWQIFSRQPGLSLDNPAGVHGPRAEADAGQELSCGIACQRSEFRHDFQKCGLCDYHPEGVEPTDGSAPNPNSSNENKGNGSGEKKNCKYAPDRAKEWVGMLSVINIVTCEGWETHVFENLGRRSSLSWSE